MKKDISVAFGPLVKARFLERPNRFVVHCRVESSGDEVTAHLADPGRLKELLVPGALLFLRPSENPQRSTKWTVVLVEAPGSLLVSLQSTLVNQLTGKALQAHAVPALTGWSVVRPEYSWGSSRFDFLLESAAGKKLLLEVKSCTLVQDGTALFPDAVTERGARHLRELTELQRQGDYQTAVLFVIQRSDALRFAPAVHIDARFAEALRQAHAAGVRILAYNCVIDEEGITWGQELPVQLV